MAVSLRQKLISAGITDEPTIQAHLRKAALVVRLVPNVRISKYNPRIPMENVNEG